VTDNLLTAIKLHNYSEVKRLVVLVISINVQYINGVAPYGIGRDAHVRWNQDCSREMSYLPHLLVVGARNSDDLGPVGS
jgi:hypothetical protein